MEFDSKGGEQEMKQKLIAVLGLLVMLIGMFSMVLTVKADKTDGQWVAVTQTFDKVISPPRGEITKLDSSVVQFRDVQYIYTAHLTVGSTTYRLYAVTTDDGSYNPTTDVMNTRYDIIWYVYTGSIPAASDNGFAGNFESKLTNVISYPPPVYGVGGGGETIHCLLQGFGSFSGQTLMLTFDGSVHGGDLTGFLLVK